ncbi:MAG: DNA-3-methyladenine glycosylase I [Pseudomonadota bacterium]
MDSFDTLYQRAIERAGGERALQARLPRVKSARALARTRDDRWLAEMTRCIFQAGFVWRVVDAKWDDFEDVFFGFPPERIVMLSPEQIDRFSHNPRIIRNRQKVLSIQENAHFILDIAREHGSFGKFVSRWPTEDLVGLFELMKRRGCRLGGMSGQRVLRNMGKDTYILTKDVVECLNKAGLDITNVSPGKTKLKEIQACFNSWQQDSKLPMAHLSRICAISG